jgi:hypothetical protein
MNWKDEYDNMVINEQIENKDDILKSWGNYYGSDDTANWELDSYESEVEDLIENGGNIYRVLFVDNLSEINLKDMGNHWTTSRDNVIDVAEINQQYYGKNKQKVKRFLQNFELVKAKMQQVEESDRLRNWQPPITGELVMEVFGLNPGKNVGIIKDAIREAILDGLIPNNYEAAYQYMLEKGEELNLKPIK